CMRAGANRRRSETASAPMQVIPPRDGEGGPSEGRWAGLQADGSSIWTLSQPPHKSAPAEDMLEHIGLARRLPPPPAPNSAFAEFGIDVCPSRASPTWVAVPLPRFAGEEPGQR